MWRAEHGQALGVAAIQHLPGDQRSLDRLADADIVGDQQPHRLEPECHQQRNELIRTGVDGDAPERAERPGGRAETEPESVAEQASAARIARRRWVRGRERRRCDWLELWENPGDLVIGGPEGPEDSSSGCLDSGRTSHSRPRARDERSDWVGDGAGHGSAPVLAKDACEAIQNRAPIVGMVETDDLPAEVIEASVDARVICLFVGFVMDADRRRRLRPARPCR